MQPESVPSDEQRSERRQGQGPGRPPSKKQRIVAWLEDRGWTRVTEAQTAAIAEAFPDCSEETIRSGLLDWSAKHRSGEVERRLDPLVEGVRQDTLDHLAGSLTSLLLEYERSDNARRAQIRKLVLKAKEHANLAAANHNTSDEKRVEKIEAVLWLRTWLENPTLFPEWVGLRRHRLAEQAGGAEEAEDEDAGDADGIDYDSLD